MTITLNINVHSDETDILHQIAADLAETKQRQVELIMAAIDDLKAAVSALGTSISSEIAAVKTAIETSTAANAGAVSATDAEALVATLGKLKDTVDAETATLAGTPPAAGGGAPTS